jgi:hypothetical protein
MDIYMTEVQKNLNIVVIDYFLCNRIQLLNKN